jgi:hypothetical protein
MKVRTTALAAVAALGIGAVAHAQQNSYTVTGKVSPKGGSAKKPKPVSVDFGFTNSDPSGILPSPIETYSIRFEGLKVNTKDFKACTAASMTAAKSDAGCSSGARMGTGTIESLVGAKGSAASSAAKCNLALTFYNAGTNKAALWLNGAPPTCIATIAEAIPAKFVKTGRNTAIEFTVPETLRHQLGLDVVVTKVGTKLPRKTVTKRKKGKRVKVGYFESLGCPDKKRDLTVTFTDETGTSTPVKQTLNGC